MTLLRATPIIEALIITYMVVAINMRSRRQSDHWRQVPYIFAALHTILFYIVIIWIRESLGLSNVFVNVWSAWLKIHLLSVLILELYWRMKTWKPI